MTMPSSQQATIPPSHPLPATAAAPPPAAAASSPKRGGWRCVTGLIDSPQKRRKGPEMLSQGNFYAVRMPFGPGGHGNDRRLASPPGDPFGQTTDVAGANVCKMTGEQLDKLKPMLHKHMADTSRAEQARAQAARVSLKDVPGALDDDEWQATLDAFDEFSQESPYHAIGGLTAEAMAAIPLPPLRCMARTAEGDVLEEPVEQGMQLIARLRDSISALLATRAVRCPPASDAEAVKEFCIGYMLAVETEPVWRACYAMMPNVSAIAVLAGRYPFSQRQAFYDKQISEKKWRQQARQRLPKLLMGAYDMLNSTARMIQLSMDGDGNTFELPALAAIDRRPAPVAVAKVGRNKPCPCGSGKKYKKCCIH